MSRSDELTRWLQRLDAIDPNHIDLGLDRLHAIAQLETLTQFACPVISVAGTNGKGSCVALLQSIAQAAGLRVGTYTSPHLHRFNERICINGQSIDDASLVTAFAHIDKQRANIPLTYFEFTTLSALAVFQQHPLDLVILEVGLGGRLDAVNIVDADIAVITSIDLDHCDWLGDTRDAIAYEKAGIMRAHKPAICGDLNPPPRLINHAANLAAPLLRLNHDFQFESDGNTCTWHNAQQQFTQLPLSDLGLDNAAVAIQALLCLSDHIQLDADTLRQGLKQAQLRGRFEQHELNGITCIYDVAHNPAAAQRLSKRLQNFAGRTLTVVAMLKDKDITNTFAALEKCIDSWYVASLALPRAASIAKQLECLKALHCTKPIHAEADLQHALRHALNDATPSDRILIFGSFYTVAALL